MDWLLWPILLAVTIAALFWWLKDTHDDYHKDKESNNSY